MKKKHLALMIALTLVCGLLFTAGCAQPPAAADALAGAARRLLAGDTDFLLESGDPLLIEFYSKLRGELLMPRTIVTYAREAFVYEPGNVRITIDRDLRTGLASTDFLNAGLWHAPVSDGLAVLEVKYDAFLPELARLAVQLPNRRMSAFSKYAACRRYD